MSKLQSLVDELSNLTLLEASQLAKMLREHWNISDAPHPMMTPAVNIIKSVEEAVRQEYFDVVLKDIGPKKIEVIKTLRQLTTLGLKEAKDLVEAPLATLLSQVEEERAIDAQSRLMSVGAVVELI